MWETILTGALSLIAGGLTTFMFFPQIRKNKNLENEAKQSEEWRKLYEEERNEKLAARQEVEVRDQKISSMYDVISHHRDQKAELRKQITELEVENTRLTLLKCEIPGCVKRKPPTGY